MHLKILLTALPIGLCFSGIIAIVQRKVFGKIVFRVDFFWSAKALNKRKLTVYLIYQLSKSHFLHLETDWRTYKVSISVASLLNRFYIYMVIEFNSNT